MSRRKPQDVAADTRAAWAAVVATLTRDELVALNFIVNRELTKRNAEKKAARN